MHSCLALGSEGKWPAFRILRRKESLVRARKCSNNSFFLWCYHPPKLRAGEGRGKEGLRREAGRRGNLMCQCVNGARHGNPFCRWGN